MPMKNPGGDVNTQSEYMNMQFRLKLWSKDTNLKVMNIKMAFNAKIKKFFLKKKEEVKDLTIRQRRN